MKHDLCTLWVQLENGPVSCSSAIPRRAIEVVVGAHDQYAPGKGTVAASKGMKHGLAASRCKLEHCAATLAVTAGAAPRGRCPVKIILSVQDQAGVGNAAVAAVLEGTKHPLGSCRGHFEDGTAALFMATVAAAKIRRAVKIAVRVRDQASQRFGAITSTHKRIENFFLVLRVGAT